MGTGILDAAGLGDTKREESTATAEAIENADGFARCSRAQVPHRRRAAEAGSHRRHDRRRGQRRPALKKADCGIAVSGATDAARAAASIVLMKPGLSVIIDAVKESRRIVQRMNSYAIYRIAETLRSCCSSPGHLDLQLLPVTAIMIVVLALLNDGSILSIAYDKVHYKDQPRRGTCAWSSGWPPSWAWPAHRRVRPVPDRDRVYHLGHPQLQTLMYLMLSVAGSMTIYLTRTRGPFWSIRPAGSWSWP